MLPKLNLFNIPIQSPDAKKDNEKTLGSQGAADLHPRAVFQGQRCSEQSEGGKEGGPGSWVCPWSPTPFLSPLPEGLQLLAICSFSWSLGFN